ncbi:MAG: hypothetical protein Q4B43_05350 [Bacteroidota bacterium]|uniref:hypothetical protein n=1 Tax=Capnocytophaga TaxID=1016 RepID=UPI001AD12490|nr:MULTISPECIES: hypothetical protein [Capnocytophaga]MDO4728415.1 hypothetical protein [Bacteroidota bacterium]GIM51994.1 hypothetical protein CAPN004_10240 [Capnocytophaga cynodegmi]GIM61380.1 hypothetical protein CAPN008_14300 [Capnocytophaga canis]
MKTHYFTFCQMHVYRFNGYTLDKDCVVMITAENPRAEMEKHFGLAWGFQYEEKPEMKYFPRGIYNLTENKWE